MLAEFKEHISLRLPFLERSKLLVACSGGVDSVVLFHLLQASGFDLALAHCNFNLRGKESDEDEVFVSDLAERYELPFFSESFSTESFADQHKMSVQMAARELRYSWFEEILTDFKFDFVLTAHHADDNIETFFINLLRSTGLRGLSGIPEVNANVVRPLLSFSKDQILEYAKTEGLFWREDNSNQDEKYLRNEIRHKLIPILKDISPEFMTAVRQTQQHLKDSRDLIADYMVLVAQLTISETDSGLEIDITKLKELPHKESLLYELLSPYGFTSWDDISALIDAQSGKQVYSPTHRILKDRESLILTPIPQQAEEILSIDENMDEITEPVHIKLAPAKKFEITNAHTAFVDREKLKFPLELRKWKEGDWFYPLGLNGKKKLSKYFKDEKLSLVAKENCWVISSDDQVMWVVGMRLDDRFKVTKNTREILRIDYFSN